MSQPMQTRSALLEQDRATVVMACGTGKTLLEMWAANPIRITNLGGGAELSARWRRTINSRQSDAKSWKR